MKGPIGKLYKMLPCDPTFLFSHLLSLPLVVSSFCFLRLFLFAFSFLLDDTIQLDSNLVMIVFFCHGVGIRSNQRDGV